MDTFILCCFVRCIDIVKFLVDEGASIEIEDIEGKTPLDVANEYGYFETLRLLINKAIEKDKLGLVTSFLDKTAKARGIDVYDPDSWRHDWKIIHYAVYYGNLDIVRDILKFPPEKVGDVHSVSDGWVAIHYAVYYNRKDIISFLIDQGSSIEVQAVYGQRTPLHIAIEEGRSDIFALLISKGAKIDAIDTEKNQTPIQKAREKGRSDMVKLLEYIVSLNGTPLHHYAAQEGKLELVKFLLNNGANIEAKDVNGSTPLLYAVQENRLDVVRFLVGRGANINAGNNFDQTPLEPGRSGVSQEIINFLREEQNKIPVRRKRRHHHGDHPRHHSGEQKHLQVEERSVRLELKRDSRGIENDNSAIENNQATSGASKPSSWTNAFAYIVDAIKGVSQFISFPFKPAIDMEHSQTSKAITTQGIDTNGTLLLLDVFVRKITGQKYISTAGQCISPLEAQGCALNIIEGFEKVIEQAARDNKISTHRLNVDFVEIQKEITGKIMSGKFNEVSGILNSYIEKAYPGKEVGCPGKLSLKKFSKFMTEFNKRLDVALNQPMQQILSRDSTLKASNVKEQQISLEPRSYLNNTSVQGHLTQDRDLKKQGKVLIP